jgi:hypothetical protein
VHDGCPCKNITLTLLISKLIHVNQKNFKDKKMYDLNCIAKAFTIYEADDLCKMRRHMHDQK